jgi:hypothetical protein
MTGRDAGSVMAELHFERATVPAVKAAWKTLARQLARLAVETARANAKARALAKAKKARAAAEAES